MSFFSRFNVFTQTEVIEGLITRSINDARKIGAQQRNTLRQTMIDFFENNQHAEDYYLKQYGFEKRKSLPFVSEPLTQRVIQENSLVYDFVPERRVVNSQGKASKREGLVEFYAENPQIDFGVQALEQYQNLLHNVLLRVEYDPYFSKIMVYIETAFLPHFMEHNPLYPVGYSIPVKVDTTKKANKMPELIYLYVSDTEMYLHDEEGVRVKDERFNGKNPYGVSTVIDVSPFPASEYWSLGAKTLVDCNIVLNVLQQVWAYSFQYSTFRQAWGTGITKEIADNLRFGFDEIWWAQDTDAKFGTLEGDDFNISANMDALERWISRQLDHYNISMNFQERGNVIAGVTLKLKKGRLLKKFKKEATFWKIFEQRLHKVIGAVAEYHDLIKNVDLEKDKIISDFIEPTWSVETPEDRDDWDWRVQRGAVNWRDFIRAENRDLTPEEADERLKENLEHTNKLLKVKRFNERFEIVETELEAKTEAEGKV